MNRLNKFNCNNGTVCNNIRGVFNCSNGKKAIYKNPLIPIVVFQIIR